MVAGWMACNTDLGEWFPTQSAKTDQQDSAYTPTTVADCPHDEDD
jgi:hypothetical protein